MVAIPFHAYNSRQIVQCDKIERPPRYSIRTGFNFLFRYSRCQSAVQYQPGTTWQSMKQQIGGRKPSTLNAKRRNQSCPFLAILRNKIAAKQTEDPSQIMLWKLFFTNRANEEEFRLNEQKYKEFYSTVNRTSRNTLLISCKETIKCAIWINPYGF